MRQPVREAGPDHPGLQLSLVLRGMGGTGSVSCVEGPSRIRWGRLEKRGETVRKGRGCPGGDGTGWSWAAGQSGAGRESGAGERGLWTNEFCNMKEREGPGQHLGVCLVDWVDNGAVPEVGDPEEHLF